MTAPAVRPSTIYFCAMEKSSMVGINARTDPAAISPHLMSKLKIREFRPTGIVLFASELINIIARYNSFHELTNAKINVAIIPEIGRAHV